MKLSENIRYMADHLSEVNSDYLKDIAASVENMEVEIPELPDDFATLRDQLAIAALQGLTSIPNVEVYDAENKEGVSLEEWRSRLAKNDAEYCYFIADSMLEARK